VIISFAEPARVYDWLSRVGIEGDSVYMLLDPHRHSYEQYGMNRSFKSSYSPSTLLFYLRSYWRGEYRLRSTEEDVSGDTCIEHFQMNQNLIISNIIIHLFQ